MKVMKRYYFLFAILSGGASAASAQSEEEAVIEVVAGLFNGMRAADSVLVKEVFHTGAIMQTVVEKEDGSTDIRTQAADDFAKRVGMEEPGTLDERIRFDMVKVDGKLAAVWTPYLFNYNGDLRHCGVNSFQLIKTKGGWKIHYMIDTRQKDGCGPSHLFK